MRRVDLALIAITLVLGAVWFYLRQQAPDPEPAGSVSARATTSARTPGRATPAPARSSRPVGPRASGEPAEPAPEGLRVEADVPDADVFVDRVYKGKAPLVLSDVVSGSHQQLRRGRDGYAETVEVTGDQLVSVRFKQVRPCRRRRRAQARIGSCRGRSHARPACATRRKRDDSSRCLSLSSAPTRTT